jgi:hypothetical protein
VTLALTGLAINFLGCGRKEKAAPGTQEQSAVQPPAAVVATDTVKTTEYPLDYCIVTGEKLGSMGEPVVYVHEGRTIKFCCNGCVATFKQDPAKWLAKIDEAVKAKAK